MPKRPGVHISPCAHFQGKPNLGRNARPLAEAHRTGQHPLQKAQRIWSPLCATPVAFQNKPLYNLVLERVGSLFIFSKFATVSLLLIKKNPTISNSVRNKHNPKEIYTLSARRVCVVHLFLLQISDTQEETGELLYFLFLQAQTKPQLNLHVSLKIIRKTWRRPKKLV